MPQAVVPSAVRLEGPRKTLFPQRPQDCNGNGTPSSEHGRRCVSADENPAAKSENRRW